MLTTATPIFKTLKAGLSASLLAVLLSACGSPNWGFPYRATVQQGNWITSEQVQQLQKGMSREQVRYILGTPTLQDIFRTDRWDYPFMNKPGYGATQQRQFTVWFQGDSLVRWEGDEQPDRQPFERADPGMTPGKAKATPDTATPNTPATTAPIPDGSTTTTSAPQAEPNDTLEVGGTPSMRGNTASKPQSTGLVQPGTVESIERPGSGSSAPAHRRPIINANPGALSDPGVPTPGRDTTEPLR